MKKMIKKITAALIAIVLCLSVIPFASAQEDVTVILRGDANCDGVVNSSDALLVLRCAVGRSDPEFDHYWGDLNGDGVINSADALRILQIAVGSDNPSQYSEEELLKFYSDAFKMSCQDPVTISYYSQYESVLYNNDDHSDYREFYGEYEYVEGYVNGYDQDGHSAFDFCPLTWIDIGDVALVEYSKDEDGYHCIKVTLKEEWSDFDNPVPEMNYGYTKNYSDCTISGIDELEAYDGSGCFEGTEITAYINPEGYMTALHIIMPFELYMSLADEYGYHYAYATEYGYIYDSYYFNFS